MRAGLILCRLYPASDAECNQANEPLRFNTQILNASVLGDIGFAANAIRELDPF
jgi:hypothetical protein